MYNRKIKILIFILLLSILSMPSLTACKGSPQASFTASAISGKAPFLVTFTNTSKNADGFRWEFGDGESQTTSAIAETVSHEYTRAGNLTARLTAYKSDNPSVTSTIEVTISVEPGDFAQVNIVPETAVVDIGANQEFLAECTDAYGNEITDYQLSWELRDDIGTLKAGTFIAGTKSGEFSDVLVATVNSQDSTIEEQISIIINTGPLFQVTIPPTYVAAGGEQQMEFIATDEYGNSIDGLSSIWVIRDESVGSITTAGILRSIKKMGNHPEAIEVSVTQGEIQKTDIGDVTIIPAGLSQLFVAPENIDLGMGKTQQYIAVGADEFGNRIDDIVLKWEADDDAGSFISGGLFTAGTTPGKYKNGITVEATWNGETLSESIDIVVEPDKIIFVSNRSDSEEDQYDLYIIDADGSNIKQLTHLSPESVRSASCSPDGRRIAFVTADDMYIINTDGMWQTHILDQSGIRDLSWSPDGEWIVFDVWEENSADIYVVKPDGSDLRSLTDNDAYDIEPQYSPDGSKIAFVSTRDYANTFVTNLEIYVMNADGSNEKRVIEDAWPDWEPNWSPDSKYIIYTSARYGYYGLYTVKPDGTELNRFYTPNDKGVRFAGYSPDGDRVITSIGQGDFGWELVILQNLESDEFEYLPITDYHTDNRASNIRPTWMNRKQGVLVTQDSINIPDSTGINQEMTVQQITEALKDAVVRIETELGSGSGFIIDSNGLILTNNHVISGAEEITVFLEDGTSYSGTVLARDPSHDMAVVKIDAVNLPALEIGGYDSVELGQQVVVLGYPLGNENISVTSGLVSAIEYDSGTNITWIQTDSAVNPGNSGGPMLNMQGQVIGMVTAKLVGEAIEGIGYAISIITINIYLPALLE